MSRLGVSLLALLLGSATTKGVAADRFVSATGSDAANDCLSGLGPCRTVAQALGQAASGDSVKIAAGS